MRSMEKQRWFHASSLKPSRGALALNAASSGDRRDRERAPLEELRSGAKDNKHQFNSLIFRIRMNFYSRFSLLWGVL